MSMLSEYTAALECCSFYLHHSQESHCGCSTFGIVSLFICARKGQAGGKAPWEISFIRKRIICKPNRLKCQCSNHPGALPVALMQHNSQVILVISNPSPRAHHYLFWHTFLHDLGICFTSFCGCIYEHSREVNRLSLTVYLFNSYQ